MNDALTAATGTDSGKTVDGDDTNSSNQQLERESKQKTDSTTKYFKGKRYVCDWFDKAYSK